MQLFIMIKVTEKNIPVNVLKTFIMTRNLAHSLDNTAKSSKAMRKMFGNRLILPATRRFEK